MSHLNIRAYQSSEPMNRQYYTLPKLRSDTRRKGSVTDMEETSETDSIGQMSINTTNSLNDNHLYGKENFFMRLMKHLTPPVNGSNTLHQNWSQNSYYSEPIGSSLQRQESFTSSASSGSFNRNQFGAHSGKTGYEMPAVCGIKNHGNTCFMTAIIQCLCNTDLLAEYFVMNHYKIDLLRHNKLHAKKYGTKGELTEQLALLLKSLWSCMYSSEISSKFKTLMAKYSAQYEGSEQHDAQEFLLWLLDKCHEDLNIAEGLKEYKKIPAVSHNMSDEQLAAETLANHMRCNSSFIHDLFQAQLRSSLVCRSCGKQSNTFDPYLCLSLPVPVRLTHTLIINSVFFDRKPREIKIGVTIESLATIRELRDKISHLLKIPEKQLILLLIGQEFGLKELAKDTDIVQEVLEDMNEIYALETPKVDQNYTNHNSISSNGSGQKLTLIWSNRVGIGNQGKIFGPLFSCLISREASYKQIQLDIISAMRSMLKHDFDINSISNSINLRLRVIGGIPGKAYLPEDVDHPLYMSTVDKALYECENKDYRGPTHLKLMVEWDFDLRQTLLITDDQMNDSIVDHSIELAKARSQKTNRASLSDCFDMHFKEEQLCADNAWTCPSCKRRQQCTKKLNLWSVPDIFIIHLKRFRQSSQSQRNKVTTHVVFPQNGLDMSLYLEPRQQTNGCANSDLPTLWSPWKRSRLKSDDTTYDLYAVCNHKGNMQSGHYTSYCRNPIDNCWYHFDDAKVVPISESSIITSDAYILFYQKSNLSSSLSSCASSSTSGYSSSTSFQISDQNKDVISKCDSITPIPEDIRLMDMINTSSLHDCDKLCSAADVLLLKSHEKEREGDLKTAAVLTDSAALKARSAMEAPYSNHQTLITAKMKHSICVMRSATLHKRINEIETEERRRVKEQLVVMGSHSRQGSRDSTHSKHSRQGSRDNKDTKNKELTTNHTLVDTNNHSRICDNSMSAGKTLELYATLPKKGSKKKLFSKVLQMNNENLLKHSSRESDYSDYYSEWEGTRKAQSVHKSISGSVSCRENDTEIYGEVDVPAVPKKQHRVKRKLLMGGFMKRKNRSLPDLREDIIKNGTNNYANDAINDTSSECKTIAQISTKGFHQSHRPERGLYQRPALLKVSPPFIEKTYDTIDSIYNTSVISNVRNQEIIQNNNQFYKSNQLPRPPTPPKTKAINTTFPLPEQPSNTSETISNEKSFLKELTSKRAEIMKSNLKNSDCIDGAFIDRPKELINHMSLQNSNFGPNVKSVINNSIVNHNMNSLNHNNYESNNLIAATPPHSQPINKEMPISITKSVSSKTIINNETNEPTVDNNPGLTSVKDLTSKFEKIMVTKEMLISTENPIECIKTNESLRKDRIESIPPLPIHNGTHRSVPIKTNDKREQLSSLKPLIAGLEINKCDNYDNYPDVSPLTIQSPINTPNSVNNSLSTAFRPNKPPDYQTAMKRIGMLRQEKPGLSIAQQQQRPFYMNASGNIVQVNCGQQLRAIPQHILPIHTTTPPTLQSPQSQSLPIQSQLNDSKALISEQQKQQTVNTMTNTMSKTMNNTTDDLNCHNNKQMTRKKSAFKKSVSFSDQVVLVACADEDQEEYLPNPILDNILAKHNISFAPQSP
ncbi:uncharacterized protein LOC128965520 [Oppia nitens]|uniref:uncharacterized protein LOC128965520 n=1 Tax=Oppia nitens TaxID=1686743 RepID=UPI0023DCAF9F|nr:uncharacterized protein LOC128965520 [Oppia nitens]